MAATTYKVVVISYRAEPRLDERTGVGSILPGMLLERTSADKVQAHSDDAPTTKPLALFAVENPYQDNDTGVETIDTPYADGEWIRYIHAHPGDHIYALLEDEANVAIGAALESNGAGALQAVTTGIPIARALQAVNNTGGTGPVHIKVEVL